MIKRKLQILLFGLLISFSNLAQSQTVVNNTTLTQLTRTFVAAYLNLTFGNPDDRRAARMARNEAGRAVLKQAGKPGELSGGSIVIGGETRTITSVVQFRSVINEFVADNPNIDPLTIQIRNAVSPNS